MMENVKPKEIVYCNLKIKHKNDSIWLKKVVYKHEDGFFRKAVYLKHHNIHEPVEVLEVDVISRLGFENNATGFTTVKKNDEKRNNITGAYE